MKKILVIDDDREACELLGEIFGAQGWQVVTALSPAAATEAAALQGFDLVVSDINLEARESGLDLLRRLRDTCPVILVTGFGSLDTAVEASREGAWDFISKPFKVDEVVASARRALERNSAAGRDSDTASAVDGALPLNASMVGRAPAMIELYKEIARVARAKSTVLIVGESGTGKELVARALHEHSQRSSGPFVPVNCGAVTESLLEAELFGHVRGAYTGATSDRKGLWEEAEAGTLFLDEIGETTPSMQVKLLRALQNGEIKRVGAARSFRVDSRVIAATNRDLEAEAKAGKFREDLYYRLSAVTLTVPPLRDRRGDIPLLVERFLDIAAQHTGRGRVGISKAALHSLVGYDWPGNIRELESTIEYAALRAPDKEITPDDLPARILLPQGDAARQALHSLYGDLPSLSELERRYLIHVLEEVKGNRTRAAEVMGIDRRTLYRMAERYGVALDD